MHACDAAWPGSSGPHGSVPFPGRSGSVDRAGSDAMRLRAGTADPATLHGGHRRTSAEPRRRRLADDPADVRRLGLQPARSDYAGQRRAAAARLGVLDRRDRAATGAADRERRRHVHRHAEQPGDRARRQDRRTALALPPPAARRCHRAARNQPRRRAVRRQGVLRARRGGARRARRPNRSRGLDDARRQTTGAATTCRSRRWWPTAR